MEFSEDFVKENELNEQQVEALKGLHESTVAELKKEWDGKANENAEGILSGAAKYAAEKAGVKMEREKGEKYGDYLQRITDTTLESSKTELEKKKHEIEEKLKNFKGGDEYKEQLETLRSEKDALMQQVAELEPLKGIDEKYKEATEKLTGLKLNVAFNEVKPNFSQEVNPYEAKAKWDEFKKDVLERYDIEIVDNEAMAIDKENKYKTVKLSELVKQNESITELLKGRQQGGTGGKPVDLKDVEGVPFKVPANASNEEKSKLTREHLIKKLGSATHKDFAKEFQELYTKINQAASAA